MSAYSYLGLKKADENPDPKSGGEAYLSRFGMIKKIWTIFIVFGCLSLMVLYTNFTSAPAISDEVTVSSGSASESPYKITMRLIRIGTAPPFKFRARVTLRDSSNQWVPGKALEVKVDSGVAGAVKDNQNGTYDFVVIPKPNVVCTVTVSIDGASITRSALGAGVLGAGVGMPQAVPGEFVNTPGYEDGVTITPDGRYLFVQYGPIYFSGFAGVSSICNNPSYSMYDILGCHGKPNSNWVFETIGPYAAPLRPQFPVGAIREGKLTHSSIVIPGLANGLAIFPTVFYGFRRQADGTFAQPFKLSFNDARGTNGPFGLSFQMTSANTARYVVAWNNHFDDLGGDGSPNIYSGTITMGRTNNMGNVTYSGEAFASITPNIQPVNFPSHSGVQGNPHLYYDSGGVVRSIWTDDEQVSHDLSVYRLVSGDFPGGNWVLTKLPNKINTPESESQPFFTGTRLYMNRGLRIVYHDYLGSGGDDYHLDSSWGEEVVVIKANPVLSVGNIIGFGEPTLATFNGQKLLYFAFVRVRAPGAVLGTYDFDLDAGFVEVP